MQRCKWLCMETKQPNISTEPAWLTQLAELAMTPAQPTTCPNTWLPSVSWGFVHLKPCQVWCLRDLMIALRKRTQRLVSCRTSWVLLYCITHALVISSILAKPKVGHSHAKPKRHVSTKTLHCVTPGSSEDNPGCHNKVKSCQAYVFSLHYELHTHSCAA